MRNNVRGTAGGAYSSRAKSPFYPRMTVINAASRLLAKIQSQVSGERFVDPASRLAVSVTVGATARSSPKDAIVSL